METGLNKILLWFGLLIVMVSGIMIGVNIRKSPGVNTALAKALADTLRTTRDSLGRETANKLTLISDIATLNTLLQNKNGLLQGKDDEIKRLMKGTKKTEDATYIKNNTTDSVTSKPVYVDTTNHIYKYQGEDKWFRYQAMASPEVLLLKYSVTNEYVLRHDKVKDGVETTIKNMNPHTATEEVISYKTAYPAPKKWNLSIGVGYGVSTDLRPRPFIGITVGKSLIRF